MQRPELADDDNDRTTKVGATDAAALGPFVKYEWMRNFFRIDLS